MSPCYLPAQETIPKLILPFGHTSDIIWSGQFSPNGKFIITVAHDNTAKIWEVESGKMLQSLEGHTNLIRSAQYSPDGKRILTSSRDKTAKVWDGLTGELLLALSGHTDEVWSGQFSPDGKRILTSSLDSTAKVWDSANGNVLLDIRGHTNEVSSAQFSPDGTRILTASLDKTAKVWDGLTGELLLALSGHTDEVWSGQFSPDGKYILTTSKDLTAKVWDAVTGEVLLDIRGHTKEVSSAQFSSNGKYILTTSWDKAIKVWDASTGELLMNLQGHTSNISSAVFSSDGKRILTASWDKTAKVWDSANGNVLLDIRGHTKEVSSAQFSSNGKYILTTSRDKAIKVWDASTGELLQSLEGDAEWVSSAQFSSDGKLIVTTSMDNTAKLWDVSTGGVLQSLESHTDQVGSAQFSSDGKLIVTASMDSTAKVWDVSTGELLKILEGHTNWVISAQFSSDGNRILTSSLDKTAKVWDGLTGELLQNLKHTNWFRSAQFSSDERLIVTASMDSTAKVWDVSTGELLQILEGHTAQVNSAQFSPDGSQIITTSDDKTAKVWCSLTGQMLLNLGGFIGQVNSAQFSPDGSLIITTSHDKTVKVWNSATGKLLQSLEGHTDLINSAQFSFDGKLIVTTSMDNTAKLWDASTGQLLQSLEGHTDQVHSAQFSPDGKRILTSGWDNKTILWDTQTGKMLYTHLQLKDNNWLVYDEHYRYDGSAGAREKLYFVCGLEVIELNQLKDALYVPGLASKIMKGEDINFPKLYDLEICNVFPEIREMPAEDHFFHYHILPRRKKIESIEIWLNDKRIRSIPADSLSSGPEGVQLILPKSEIEPLYIPGEENKLKINAVVNLMGTEARSRGMIVSGLKNKEKKASPRLFALMIGVDTYKDQSLQLRFPAKDASDLGKVLQLSAEKFLGEDRVHMYYIHSMVGQTGGYTTPEKEGIRRALEEIGRMARPEDVVLIFFAGHGVLRPADGLFTLLTAEASSLLPTGITTAELMDWISPEGPYALKANKSILIFDACHSGKGAEELIAWSRRSDEETRRRRQIDDLSDKAGMYILAASASNQSAYEVRHYEQGLLTYSLLHTLQNNPGILDDQQFLNVQKWFLDSERHLQQLVRELGLEQQAQPYGSANIRIGMVDEEVRSAIRLAEVRPLMYCALAMNRDTDVDDLGLKSALNHALKAVSDRGSNAPFMFSEQGSSTAYTINISYEWSERQLSARITLLKGKEVLFRTNVEGSTENIPELIEAIIVKISNF
jgi:WD40 repeat protein